MAKTIQKTLELSRKCRGPQDLSRLELVCMKAIWLRKASTVLEVQRCLEPERPLAYTTVLTILDRLAHKGAVSRAKKGKVYFYAPALSFVESRDMALQELVDFYFEGSPQNLIHHLTQQQNKPITSSPEISDSLL